MGRISQPLPVKLIVPMFSGDEGLFLEAESRLEGTFGPIDYRSGTLPFTHTSYYTPEFGPSLLRKFLAFERLIDPSSLADVKHETNALEHELASDGKRRINLDPGYISQSKLVLATTKDHSHRIYLDKGIYAEVTLRYQNKAFVPGSGLILTIVRRSIWRSLRRYGESMWVNCVQEKRPFPVTLKK